MSPFLRLCSFWFLYMGALGMFFPFYGLYLDTHAGLSGVEVGAVLSMLPVVGLLAQPVWGQAADRSGARSGVLAVLAIGTGLAQLLLYQARGFGELLIATALLAVFASSVMPMALSVSLAVLHGSARNAFGVARASGTVGYLVAVVAFPLALAELGGAAPHAPGAPAGLGWMFPAIAVLAMLAGVVALALPREGAVAVRAARDGLDSILRHGPMRRVMAYAFLAYLFLNGPIQLFPLFVRSLGGGLADVSRMWLFMLLLEIPLVAWSGTLLARLGSRGLLGIGVFMSGLRWAGSAFSDDIGVATALGVLHGVGVVGLGIGGALYVEEVAPPGLRSTGQALLATVGVGLGGILSNLVCGWLFDHAGAQLTYLVCGLGAMALGLVVTIALPHASRVAASPSPA